MAHVDAKLVMSVDTASVPALLDALDALASEHVDGPYLAQWCLDVGSWGGA